MLAIIFTAIAALLLMVVSADATAPRRVALVVGNGGYQALSPLHNPALDARTLANILDANGFDVLKCGDQRPGCFDLTREGLLDVLDRLRDKAEGADLALVFYSGHGMETKADGNVLAPVDMEVVDCATRALRRGVPLENVYKAVAGAREKIVILDACRNDPFAQCPRSRGFVPVSFGNLSVPAESFMLVASTKPGDVADDGFEGAHSPFARALAYWLEKAPQVHFHQLFQVHVTHTVIEETRGGRFTQLPETRMIGPPPDGCLKGAGCVGDLQTAALAQQNEQLKAELSRDQELSGTVRDFLAQSERMLGRPLSDEERQRALENLKVVTRDIAARKDTRGERALQRLKEGDPAEAERLFAEELENETKAAAERSVRAAKAARNLAALARPTNVAKAAEYYKRATDLDPSDGQTWLSYASAALAAGRLGESKVALEQAAAKARAANNPLLLFSATLGLGDVARAQGSLPNAHQFYGTALAMAESRTAEGPEEVAAQYNVALSHSRIGDVLRRQGNLSGALERYKAAQDITERLAMADATNTRWQQGLSLSHSQIGDILYGQSNLPAALESHKAALAIIERLAKTDPGNTSWQLNLSLSHAKIGGVLDRQGNHAAALESYKADQAITERLVKADPSNTRWQHNLSASHNYLGDVLLQQGDLAAALENYKVALTIRERLAEADPSNTDWQHILAFSHVSIGAVLAKQGNLPAALERYKAALAIRERLAKTDPGNTLWQQTLSESHGLIGGVLRKRGDLAAALESYRAKLAIVEHLAEIDPRNTRWQQTLWATHTLVGDILVQQGDLPHALQSYKATLGINERLTKADPSNASWQFGLSVSQGKIGSVLWASGDRAGALANYQKALAAAETQATIIEAKEVKDAGKPGGATAQALGLSVAWSALFARDFARTLAATERARILAPDQIQPDSNRAHALLLLKRVREATTLYLAHKGQMVPAGLWEEVIANDFEELRKGGLGNPQMAKIETRLGVARR